MKRDHHGDPKIPNLKSSNLSPLFLSVFRESNFHSRCKVERKARTMP